MKSVKFGVGKPYEKTIVFTDDCEGEPLTIDEARLVAQSIRESSVSQPIYWPWVIEQLCLKIEELEAKS
jgi:hypothetical protein